MSDHGFSAFEIFKLLKCLGINNVFIYRSINQLLETNSCKNTARAGCPRSACTKEQLKRIPEKIRRNPQHSANKMAAEEIVSCRTMQFTLNEYLGFHPYL